MQDFADYTLPALEPICASASGDALLVLVKNAALLAKAMSRQATASTLVPLLARAADQGEQLPGILYGIVHVGLHMCSHSLHAHGLCNSSA